MYAGDSITLIKPVEVNKGRLVRDEDEDKVAFRRAKRGEGAEGRGWKTRIRIVRACYLVATRDGVRQFRIQSN